MKQQGERPKFATLHYDVRESLDISWAEYIYLDMVYYLSRDGWCYKSLENVAADMGMAKSGVRKMRDRLIAKKLLKKNIRGHVKTTVTYHKVAHLQTEGVHKVPDRVHKVAPSVPLSSTKNNNRYTREYRNLIDDESLDIVKTMRERLSGERM